MTEKSEAVDKCKEFKNKVESEVWHKIKCLCTDNGGAYTSYELFKYLWAHKIWRQFTYPSMPQ